MDEYWLELKFGGGEAKLGRLLRPKASFFEALAKEAQFSADKGSSSAGYRVLRYLIEVHQKIIDNLVVSIQN
jgi:hypothetical protein